MGPKQFTGWKAILPRRGPLYPQVDEIRVNFEICNNKFALRTKNSRSAFKSVHSPACCGPQRSEWYVAYRHAPIHAPLSMHGPSVDLRLSQLTVFTPCVQNLPSCIQRRFLFFSCPPRPGGSGGGSGLPFPGPKAMILADFGPDPGVIYF